MKHALKVNARALVACLLIHVEKMPSVKPSHIDLFANVQWAGPAILMWNASNVRLAKKGISLHSLTNQLFQMNVWSTMTVLWTRPA